MSQEIDNETKAILEEIGVEAKEEETPEEQPKAEEPEEQTQPEEEPSKETELEEDEAEPEVKHSPYKLDKPVIPLEKHNKKKKIWEERLLEKEEAIKRLNEELNKYKSGDVEKKINSLSETYGFDKEFVAKIVDTVKSTIPDVSKDLEIFKQQQERLAQTAMYEEDFESNALPLIKDSFPDISEQQISKVKGELKKMKFTKELGAVPLDYIFIRHQNKFSEILNPTRSKTAEKSKIGNNKEKVIDYDDLTPDDIEKMSDEEFEKYSSAMSKKGKKFIINN